MNSQSTNTQKDFETTVFGVIQQNTRDALLVNSGGFEYSEMEGQVGIKFKVSIEVDEGLDAWANAFITANPEDDTLCVEVKCDEDSALDRIFPHVTWDRLNGILWSLAS